VTSAQATILAMLSDMEEWMCCNAYVLTAQTIHGYS